MRVPPKAVLLSGLAYIAIALFHIPDALFRHGFDKNAPAQFVSIALVASLFSVAIALSANAHRYTRNVTRLGLALVSALLISTLMSGNLMGSLIGDTGRFVGALSTVSLLIVAIFHARFDWSDFRTLLFFYVSAVQLVVLAGLLQHFNLLEFPGDQGVTATLGNSDFFAAMVATSLPLLGYLAVEASRNARIIFAGLVVVDVVALRYAGPLQAWVDIALIGAAALLYFIARKLPRRDISLNKRTYLGTLAVVIWAEFIFLMPFLGEKIPVLGNDMQVKIRANFWIAGIREFFSHPILGVGPDQYGNYYEKFRTIDDVKMWPNILSNDAHSASVQTLATLGLAGTLIFIALLAVVIRSLLILWDSRSVDRRALYVLGVYIFIYLTNSFISPITPSHKYLFWAVCGFIVGRVYIVQADEGVKRNYIWLAPPAILVAVAFLFSSAQITYLSAMEKYAADNTAKVKLSYSPLIPCFMYGDAQLLVAQNYGIPQIVEVAQKLMDTNPRCVKAITYAAQAAIDRDDVNALGPLLTKLDDVAPWRSSTITQEMYYANRTKDAALAARIEKRMHELGLVYIPGKLG